MDSMIKMASALSNGPAKVEELSIEELEGLVKTAGVESPIDQMAAAEQAEWDEQVLMAVQQGQEMAKEAADLTDMEREAHLRALKKWRETDRTQKFLDSNAVKIIGGGGWGAILGGLPGGNLSSVAAGAVGGVAGAYLGSAAGKALANHLVLNSEALREMAKRNNPAFAKILKKELKGKTKTSSVMEMILGGKEKVSIALPGGLVRGAGMAIGGMASTTRAGAIGGGAALGAGLGAARGLIKNPGVDPSTGQQRSRIGAAVKGAVGGGVLGAGAGYGARAGTRALGASAGKAGQWSRNAMGQAATALKGAEGGAQMGNALQKKTDAFNRLAQMRQSGAQRAAKAAIKPPTPGGMAPHGML